jgi:hypothetical protein
MGGTPQIYAPSGGAPRATWPTAIPMSPAGGTAPWHPGIDAQQAAYVEAPQSMSPDYGSDPVEILEDYDGDYADGGVTVSGRGQGIPAAMASEWSPPVPGERPIIRPPVPGNPALRGRQTGGMNRVAGDQFGHGHGEEESELDRPTFIRRGILPPG